MMKVVEEQEDKALVVCAFCSGSGKDPFGIMSRLSHCYSCGGEKSLWVDKPFRTCSYCHGSGVSPLGARNHCLVCRGVGTVCVRGLGPICPECGGSGGNELTRLYCWLCKGKGIVAEETALAGVGG